MVFDPALLSLQVFGEDISPLAQILLCYTSKGGLPGSFSDFHGVLTVSQLSSCRLAGCASICKRYVRVDAQGQSFSLTAIPVIKAPVMSLLQIQAIAVACFVCSWEFAPLIVAVKCLNFLAIQHT